MTRTRFLQRAGLTQTIYIRDMLKAFAELLDSLNNDLITLCDRSRAITQAATQALLEGDLEQAERALTIFDTSGDIRQAAQDKAFDLLSLEQPMIRDLRQVVTGINIVADFERMDALASHIASIARDRHPQWAVPEDIRAVFAQMAQLDDELIAEVRAVLENPNPDNALRTVESDDEVDALHEQLMAQLTGGEWPHSTVEAVDTTLITRFYERIGDHCVSIAAQIVFLATGQSSSEYMKRRIPGEQERRLEDLERRFYAG